MKRLSYLSNDEQGATALVPGLGPCMFADARDRFASGSVTTG